MDVIVTGRQGGKTTRLIREAAEQFAYIVCPTCEEAHRVFRQAYDAGIRIPHPITFDEFRAGHYYGKGIRAFMFDNLDMCVQSMTSVPVTAVTLTDSGPVTLSEPEPDSPPDDSEARKWAGLTAMAGHNASISDLAGAIREARERQ